MISWEVVIWAVGIWITISAGVIGHLYVSINRIQERVEAATGKQLTEIWLAINQVKSSIDSDRQNTAENRVMIAKSMVTRDELERQVERVITELNRQIGLLRKG